MIKHIQRINLMWVYIILAPVLFSMLLFFRNQQLVVFSIAVMAAIFYVTVALLHHHRDKTLTVEVTLEYVLTAVLAIVILQSLII